MSDWARAGALRDETRVVSGTLGAEAGVGRGRHVVPERRPPEDHSVRTESPVLVPATQSSTMRVRDRQAIRRQDYVLQRVEKRWRRR